MDILIRASEPLTRERVYSSLYQQGGAFLKMYNPCQITGKECTRGNVDWCCSGCPDLGPNGCTVEALACKLWLCEEARKHSPEAAIALKALSYTAYGLGIPMGFRASKEKNFQEIAAYPAP